MKYPLDPTPHDRDPRSQAIQLGIADGNYVYVQDKNEDIFILPDGPHQHPKVLGNTEPAIYAGDLTVFSGKIRDLTNLSGTFQFSDADGLLQVANKLEAIGFLVLPGAVRLFDYNTAARPKVLR